VNGIPQPTISNFQKRLVHQLVRANYPNLVSIGKSTSVQITPYDRDREIAIQAAKFKVLQERVYKQRGFRWFFEAMVGGDLFDIDPKSFVKAIQGGTTSDAKDLLNQIYNTQIRLKSARPAFVGHNLFIDLVNFYRCFIGSLPDRVEDFQKAVHSLFPFVIDTKYVATYNCTTRNPSSSLVEIDTALSKETTEIS